MESKSLEIAKSFLGKIMNVKVDRPMGSKHPKWGFEYPVNYGFIEGVMAPDGEEFDVYILKVGEPLKEFFGKAVAIIHRLEDDDDKLVVIPEDQKISEEEIKKSVEFQEKWFKYEIILGLST